MSIINSGSFAKALWPGVNAWYGKAYNEYETEYDRLFDKFTSSKAFEEDVGISSFGLAVQKAEGAPISYDSERQGFTTRYQHAVFALGFLITREKLKVWPSLCVKLKKCWVPTCTTVLSTARTPAAMAYLS
jgi:hypothetical protein